MAINIQEELEEYKKAYSELSIRVQELEEKLERTEKLLRKAVYTASARLKYTNELSVQHQLEEENYKKNQECDKWKQIATDMYTWLNAYMQSSPTKDKSHPVHGLLQQYEEAIKEQE